ncbi:MAG TPA: hypothetical protein VK593_08300 [Edaphobacter sp.]|nr:hypothetical protein [Edaphobacter sp.]
MITTIVGFAISMAFLFLMLSAACSAIQEIIANLLHWREKTLERGLAGLLMSNEFKEEVYNQPLIQGLCSPDRKGDLSRRPSYIPSTTLALAILQAARQQNLKLDGSASALAKEDRFKKTEELLASLLRDCKDLPEQRRRLEIWFNESMDRVSDWYKRKSHAWIWIFGIILCLLLNADAISLSKRFWNDQTLRDAVAAEATEYVKSTPRDQAIGNDQEELDQSIHRINLLREQLPGVPLGWCFVDAKQGPDQKAAVKVDGFKASCWPDLVHPSSSFSQVSLAGTDPRLVDLSEWSWWLWKIVGIAATALAISQGAPFWFDLLKKAVNLRLAGAPPATIEVKK